MDLNYSQRNEVRNELKRKLRPDLVNAVRKNDDEILGQLMSALQEAFSIGYDSKLRNQVSNYLRNISETNNLVDYLIETLKTKREKVYKKLQLNIPINILAILDEWNEMNVCKYPKVLYSLLVL